MIPPTTAAHPRAHQCAPKSRTPAAQSPHPPAHRQSPPAKSLHKPDAPRPAAIRARANKHHGRGHVADKRANATIATNPAIAARLIPANHRNNPRLILSRRQIPPNHPRRIFLRPIRATQKSAPQTPISSPIESALARSPSTTRNVSASVQSPASASQPQIPCAARLPQRRKIPLQIHHRTRIKSAIQFHRPRQRARTSLPQHVHGNRPRRVTISDLQKSPRIPLPRRIQQRM